MPRVALRVSRVGSGGLDVCGEGGFGLGGLGDGEIKMKTKITIGNQAYSHKPAVAW